MHRVMSKLRARSAEYEKSPLFAFLDDTSIPARTRLSFAPCVAHFVMSFADLYSHVLREEPTSDKYQELVNTHTREDDNHWRWFLSDLAKLEADPSLNFSDSIKRIWSPGTLQMRLLSYHMCRLGFRAEPLQKMVLVYCIEAAGKVTVDHVAKVGGELGSEIGSKLVYFGPHHSETESEHTLEEGGVKDMIEAVELEASVAERYGVIVDEAFSYFTAFSNEMLNFARGESFFAQSSKP